MEAAGDTGVCGITGGISAQSGGQTNAVFSFAVFTHRNSKSKCNKSKQLLCGLVADSNPLAFWIEHRLNTNEHKLKQSFLKASILNLGYQSLFISALSYIPLLKIIIIHQNRKR